MLWLAKFLFTLSLAFNVRPSAVDNLPNDYLYESKIRSAYIDIEGQIERDTGERFNMIKMRSKPYMGVYGELNIDEEYEINREYLYADIISFPPKDPIFKLRTSHQWEYWKDVVWLGGLEVNFDTERIDTRFSYDSNFVNRHIIRFNFDYTWLEDEVWYVMPNFNYEYYGGDLKTGEKNWKIGIEYGFDFVEYATMKEEQ